MIEKDVLADTLGKVGFFHHRYGEKRSVRIFTTGVYLLREDNEFPAIQVNIMGENYCMATVRYPVAAFDQAYASFKEACELPDDLAVDTEAFSRKGMTDYEIAVYSKETVHCSSHYDYLDRMLNPFWKEVFGKTANEMWCGGIVGAHGDKCYSSKRVWAKHGIHFFRGALLFLLTYTKVMDREKHLSEEWVIDNYAKYLPMIEKVEKEIYEEIKAKVA